MKRFISILMLAMITLICNIAFAFNVPAHNGFVNDTSGKLSSRQLAALNSKVEEVNKRTANEIGVLVIPSLEGETIEDVTYKTFNTWKVGKVNLDNGVLLVLAINDRKMRIETGKGVGGELTDVQTHDIQDHMKPFLRKADFYGAINLAINEIGSNLDSRREVKKDAATTTSTPVPAPAPVATTHYRSSPSGCQTSTVGKGDVGMGFILMGVFAVAVYFVMRRHNRKKMLAAQAQAKREADEFLRKESLKKIQLAPKRAPVVSHPSVKPAPKETLHFSPVYTPAPVPSKVKDTVVPKPAVSKPAVVPVVAAVSDAARRREEQYAREREEESRRRREREAEDDRRRAREREEAAARQRREDDDRRREEASRSSYSSFSSSWDSGGSSGGFGGGGDFGGGSSGGGGSSSDW